MSPDKRFEVVLEADKGSPRYQTYEFKGDATQFPAFLLLETSGRKILTRIPWTGDAGSDAQPLRAHSGVLWSPASHAVALNTKERFYSHSEIWAFDEARAEFVKVELPDYKTCTGSDVPDSKNLRSRRYSHSAWNRDGHLVYDFTLTPTGGDDVPDLMRHRTILKVSAAGMEVVRREKYPEDEGNAP